MSAFLGMKYPDAIRVLTDGTAYDYETGTVGEIKNKAVCSSEAPFMVTGRGKSGAVDMVARDLARFADEHGVDMALLRAGAIGRKLKNDSGRGGRYAGRKPAPFDLLIVGWSQTEGPKLYSLSTLDVSPGFPPYELHDVGDIALGGPQPTDDQLFALYRRSGFVPGNPEFMAKCGADLFELMRRAPPELNIYGGKLEYTIGGHCQLTTITETGAVTETLRVWPDEVGKPINPFAEAGEVVPLLNARRAQQRAEKIEKRDRA
ncbi:hypothetical protein X747_14740 [Mesorhizobium sp. LNJC384A00]|uniref:hypothetical protein n=1 Tax=Mesorhizobium sp. LNJC384A00 TaxID=1287268 RepID=UPI0003CDD318|nr:hypothetical protein [Mesorhizobium sp. LNJC384A00]ESY42034.1 hypothetical protein X747_14740 [Mesorhizobium sp. LNJC384A00]